MKFRILLILLSMALISGCASPAAPQEDSSDTEVIVAESENISEITEEENTSLQDSSKEGTAESAASDVSQEIPATKEESASAPAVNETKAAEVSKPAPSSSSTPAPVSSAASSAAPVSSSSSIPQSAKTFFSGTNLVVHDWTVPAVSVQSSQTTGTIFVDGNGKALGNITSGKLNYDSTGYSFDVQGALDAFNDYRGLGRKDLQQGITASENPGNSGNAVQKPEADKVDASAYAQEVIRLVNNERSSAGLDALEVDSELMELAAIRAKELSTKFSHERPDGTKVSDMDYGENIYSGKSNASSALAWWMNSRGHKENLLLEGISKTGAACYQDDSGTFYWIQIFAY